MQYLNSRLRSAAARLVSNRRVIVAMLLGSIFKAMLASGTVAAQDVNVAKADVATANVITIDNFTFGPKELTVPAGTTVQWVNHDDIPHTVVEKNLSFRSKALDTDNTFSHTFASAGTFEYFCGLHPHMVGKIIVK
jgi:plastocyanin